MHTPGLGYWLSTRRVKTPNKVALIYGDGEQLTYGQFADQVDAMSALLAERGIAKGDAVAFLGENCPEFLFTMFGCARLGAIFVPVNTRLAVPEIEHVFTDSGARVAIATSPLFAQAAAAAATAGVGYLIETGEAAADGGPGLSALLRSAGSGSIPAAIETVQDDPVLIMYTSGTTGKPKGAVLSHGNLTWVALNALVDYDIVSTDVALMISPLFHAAALGMGAMPTILKGGTMVLEQGFEAGRALALIQQHGVTMLSGVPTTFQMMADHADWDATALSSLSKLTCGGAAVPTRILERYEARGLSFSQGYGMTEASPGVSSLSPLMTRDKQGSVGLAHFFTEIRIAAPDGAPGLAAAGTVGEIEVRGPNMFLGYFGLPEATASSLTEDGWFRSGDLGYVDEDGYLFIADRLKDMIISGGENIYPAEIENHISSISGVSGVAIIGAPDPQWGEVPWAVITLREDADATAFDTEAIRDSLNGQIARYKLPKRVIVAQEFPRTASGKIRKADLRAQYIQ